ncbi:MAG TPA: hypothetical protein VM101_12000 [Flavitalea sp.]|nr:hypothetical protein [Flavitalea sp.]
MKVDKVFINTYKYDFHFAKICIASIRYWYPDIPVYLIKDENEGPFDTLHTEKIWNVKVLDITRKKFGWGYGKLEVLFSTPKESFLVIDADAVLTGPIIDYVRDIDAEFIIDKEVQPEKRFNEIYFNLDRINELDKDFVYPGYSFNSGQWFGTSSIIKREDFSKTLDWSEPPASRNKDIVVNNDQGHLNYVIHSFDLRKIISVSRIRLMIWPVEGTADFIELRKIKAKASTYPYVIHWAGMSAMKFSDLPRQDILNFYKDIYYTRAGNTQRYLDAAKNIRLKIERKVKRIIYRPL